MAPRVTAGRIIAAAFLAAGLAAAYFAFDADGGSRMSTVPAQAGGTCVRNVTVHVTSTRDPGTGLLASDLPAFGPGTSINSITEVGGSTWCPRGCAFEQNTRSDAERERCEEGDGLADGCARELEYCSGVQMVLLDAEGNRVGNSVTAVMMSGPVEAAGTAFHVPDATGSFYDNSGGCTLKVVYTTTGPGCTAATSSPGTSSSPAFSAGSMAPASSRGSASASADPSSANARMADFHPLGIGIDSRGDDVVVRYVHRNSGSLDAGASNTMLSFDANMDGLYERTSTMPEQPLPAGTSVNRESQPVRIFGASMKVRICSDSFTVVPESSEANNCTDICYLAGSADTSCGPGSSSASSGGSSDDRSSSSMLASSAPPSPHPSSRSVRSSSRRSEASSSDPSSMSSRSRRKRAIIGLRAEAQFCCLFAGTAGGRSIGCFDPQGRQQRIMPHLCRNAADDAKGNTYTEIEKCAAQC